MKKIRPEEFFTGPDFLMLFIKCVIVLLFLCLLQSSVFAAEYH